MSATVYVKRKSPTQCKRSESARQSVRSGGVAEGVIASLNARCAAACVAWLRKIPTPYRVLRSVAGGLLCVPQEKSGADYVGHMSDGRAVYLEVKLVTGETLAPSRVKRWQSAELATAHAHGCLALIALVTPDRLVYVVPWFAIFTADNVRLSAMPQWLVTGDAPYLERFLLKAADYAP